MESKNVRKNPFIIGRVERIEAILKFIEKKNPAVLSEVLGVFGIKYGITEKTILAYLRQLEGAGKVILDRIDNKVSIPENPE